MKSCINCHYKKITSIFKKECMCKNELSDFFNIVVSNYSTCINYKQEEEKWYDKFVGLIVLTMPIIISLILNICVHIFTGNILKFWGMGKYITHTTFGGFMTGLGLGTFLIYAIIFIIGMIGVFDSL